MDLSDWQLDRVRSYLRAYRMYGRDDGGRYYSWSSIADAIWEYTEVKIPRERLRQFVEGFPDKKQGGIWVFSGLSPERLEAVVEFLTDEDTGIMSSDELIESDDLSRPPLQLIEMLKARSEVKSEIEGETLEGRYTTDWLDGAVIRREFVLERHMEAEGLYKVSSTEEVFDLDLMHVIDELSFEDRERERWSIGKSNGWAVLTPEDKLLLFLKEEGTGWNHQLLMVGGEQQKIEVENKGRLAILHHGFPLISYQPDLPSEEMADRAIQALATHTQVYEKKR